MAAREGKSGARFMCGAALAAITAFSGSAFAAPAHVEGRMRFDIAPQPLTSALNEFGAQSRTPIVFSPDLTGAKLTKGVSGDLAPEAALDQILKGAGLSYKRSGETYVIVQADLIERRPVRTAALSTVAAAESVSGSAVEGLVVTAQKRREAIQDVPIAISAFSADALQAQKIEGGFDLLKAIPNVTFSKTNFTSYNFSIRGIGTKAISATTDPGVAVAFNNTTIMQNRLFEQEYFDVERVEVLRGPQGTLYGRNATSGVINLISNKAQLDAFDGSIKGEVGNYHTKRLSGFINVPLIEDVLAVRFAGALTDRQGYDHNSVTHSSVNGRDLWSGRLSIGFEPSERIRADFIWERFEENDDRSRTGKQLCHRDDGPEMIDDTVLAETDRAANSGSGGEIDFEESLQILRATFAQGCKPGNLYDDAAFGTPNGLSYNFIQGLLWLRRSGIPSASTALGVNPGGVSILADGEAVIQAGDPYGGLMQSRDLREIASFRDPVYRASADLLELNVDFDITPSLTFYSQTAYVEDQTYSFQDYNRFNTLPVFTDTSRLEPNIFGNDFRELAPGGVFCDPQLGCSKTIAGFDIAQATAEQFSQEFRLQSSFDGPLNFSVGANYTEFETLIDYYVMFNVLTAMARSMPFNDPGGPFLPGVYNPGVCASSDWWHGLQSPVGGAVPTSDPNSTCPYVDPNPVESIDGEGHNYFRSKNPYSLKSWAAFGEAYWNIAEDVKLTFGLRYTNDEKSFIPVPTQVLLAPSWTAGGTVPKGYPHKPAINQEWGEWTGRVGLDWQPDLAFTDDTLLYAFYSRGYKGGGANPPKPGFATPEEIDAIQARQGFPQFLIDIYNENGVDIWPVLELTGVEYEETFEPEFVDAFEVGAKNTLFGGGMMLNVTGFYYDYKDYQVSQIRDRTAVNENFDAKTWGLEFETMFAPSEDFQIIANVGYLDTEIAKGETSIDIMNRTQGDPGYTLVKPWAQLPSNCVVPTHVAEAWLLASHRPYYGLCGVGGGLSLLVFDGPPLDPAQGNTRYDQRNYPELNGGAGILADLGGNELPNAPHWTANIGAQYSWDVLPGWSATVRGDAYWQSQSWARVYNSDPYDKLHGWYNANLSLWLEKPDDDLRIEFYVKNIMDDTPITDSFLNSDDTGLTTNVFTLDPRLIGVQITKGF